MQIDRQNHGPHTNLHLMQISIVGREVTWSVPPTGGSRVLRNRLSLSLTSGKPRMTYIREAIVDCFDFRQLAFLDASGIQHGNQRPEAIDVSVETILGVLPRLTGG